MIKIPLTNGGVAIVDSEDYERINQHRWQRNVQGHAVRTSFDIDKKQRTILMHRVVLGTPDGVYTDHIDCDKLNNSKSNLRVATASQNQGNRRKQAKCSSRYKGVSIYRDGRWKAAIQIQGKGVFLGYYHTEQLAAQAYNVAAVQYFGKFARINDIIITEEEQHG